MEQMSDTDMAALALVGYCNDRDSYGPHYFDCGDLGIIYIYWGHRGWEHRVITIEPMPTEARDEFIEIQAHDTEYRRWVENMRQVLKEFRSD